MSSILEIVKDKRVLLLIGITIAALALLFLTGGPKFGIDFSGGIRIPVLLEQPVDPITMDGMVQTIKTRAATFGLTEVKVRPVGDSAIYVEVPQSSPELVRQVENILSHQGVYLAIVDGHVAVRGEDVYEGSIRRLYGAELSGSDWGVSFSLRREGQLRSAQVQKGKANFPLYMFIDRPNDTIVVISREDLLYNADNASLFRTGDSVTEEVALSAASSALYYEGHDVPVFTSEAVAQGTVEPKPMSNSTTAIISRNESEQLRAILRTAGFTLVEVSPADIRPKITNPRAGEYIISEWAALGLRMAPILNPSVTEGVPTTGYSITGSAQGSGEALRKDADRKALETESILKGGALPVQISVGSTVEIPAPLGEEFKRLSLIGAMMVLVLISGLVAFRYRTAKIVIPILLISLSEIIILVSIIGSFSIDLAAMAGIIAAIGISVDAQIVVTDELLKHKAAGDLAHRLEGAFDIIVTNVIVACVAMLPLLFSGLVEIIGFATSTVLGYIIGLSITRPAYGAIVEKLFADDKKLVQ